MIALLLAGCFWGRCPPFDDTCPDVVYEPAQGTWMRPSDSGPDDSITVEGDLVTLVWTDPEGRTWTARYRQ